MVATFSVALPDRLLLFRGLGLWGVWGGFVFFLAFGVAPGGSQTGIHGSHMTPPLLAGKGFLFSWDGLLYLFAHNA